MAFRRSVNQAPFRRVGKKRLTEWSVCSAPTGFSTVTASTKVVLVAVPSATLADVVPATIVRTRGAFSIKPGNPGATTTIHGAFGIGLVNEVAGALGVTGIPGPWSECGWGGWLYHRFFNTFWNFNSASSALYTHIEYEIDSKAMRKVETEQRLMLIIESGGGNSFDAAVSFRMLMKAG